MNPSCKQCGKYNAMLDITRGEEFHEGKKILKCRDCGYTKTEETKMTRTSNDEIVNGRLINGYDYKNQSWVINGKYVACGHPITMDCKCYGKLHAGEDTIAAPVKKRSLLDAARVLEVAEEDEGGGFCVGCGAERMGCEPDARQYKCEDCGQNKVYGAAELILCGVVTNS